MDAELEKDFTYQKQYWGTSLHPSTILLSSCFIPLYFPLSFTPSEFIIPTVFPSLLLISIADQRVHS
jgi:hypothetical protein